MKKERGKVSITIDKDLIDRAKSKLELFGGRFSTLLHEHLADFYKEVGNKLKNFESRLAKLEKKARK